MDPQEYVEYMMAQQRRAAENKSMMDMSNEAIMQEFIDFFGRLSIADLDTARSMITASADDGARNVLFGLASGAVVYKHGRDWYGRSAEEVLLGQSESEDPSSFTMDMLHEEAIEYDGNRAEMMKIYNVEQGMDPRTRELYLRCSKCHIGITTLADRMLRAPGSEGCPSCVQKAKWG